MGSVVGSITDAIGLTDIEGTRERAEQAAAQQREAAKQAGYAASFRPIGITTRFGSSQFTEEIDPVTGLPRVTAAGYTIDPQLRAIQDRIFGLTGGALTDAEAARMAAQPLGASAQGLFGLGQQYLAESPDVARQRYMSQQYALLDPVRQREEQRLASSVFGRGRAGLNVGDIGQPELFSLAASRRAQDLALAQQAEQASRQQIGFGAGLFGTGAQQLAQMYGIPTQALGPLQSYLGTTGTIEELGQQPFNLGMQIGGRSAQAGGTAGQLLGSGLSQAAATQRAGGDAASAQLTGFMNQMLGAAVGSFGGGGSMGSLFGGGGGGGFTASDLNYLAQPGRQQIGYTPF